VADDGAPLPQNVRDWEFESDAATEMMDGKPFKFAGCGRNFTCGAFPIFPFMICDLRLMI
jgi:hypothetical protein